MNHLMEDLSPGELREEVFWEEADFLYESYRDNLIDQMIEEIEQMIEEADKPTKTNLVENLTIHPNMLYDSEDVVFIRRTNGSNPYGSYCGHRPLTKASKNRLGRMIDNHMKAWHTTYGASFMAVSYILK